MISRPYKVVGRGLGFEVAAVVALSVGSRIEAEGGASMPHLQEKNAYECIDVCARSITPHNHTIEAQAHTPHACTHAEKHTKNTQTQTHTRPHAGTHTHNRTHAETD